MEVLGTVLQAVVAVALLGFLAYLVIFTFVWSDTRVGKLLSENDRLKSEIAKKQLENDLLQRQVGELTDMVCGNSEAPAYER